MTRFWLSKLPSPIATGLEAATGTTFKVVSTLKAGSHKAATGLKGRITQTMHKALDLIVCSRSGAKARRKQKQKMHNKSLGMPQLDLSHGGGSASNFMASGNALALKVRAFGKVDELSPGSRSPTSPTDTFREDGFDTGRDTGRTYRGLSDTERLVGGITTARGTACTDYDEIERYRVHEEERKRRRKILRKEEKRRARQQGMVGGGGASGGGWGGGGGLAGFRLGQGSAFSAVGGGRKRVGGAAGAKSMLGRAGRRFVESKASADYETMVQGAAGNNGGNRGGNGGGGKGGGGKGPEEDAYHESELV